MKIFTAQIVKKILNDIREGRQPPAVSSKASEDIQRLQRFTTTAAAARLWRTVATSLSWRLVMSFCIHEMHF